MLCCTFSGLFQFFLLIQRILQYSLRESLGFFPVIGIIGPRQVGKTTLVTRLLPDLPREAIYLDLENPKDLAKLDDPVLFMERNQDKCVVLDEIQRMPTLFPVLRSMVDSHRVNARFILLGSASPDLIRDSSESLAGRIVYEELTPFLLNELIGQKDLIQHWISGGFPDACLAPGRTQRTKWHESFIRTYLERDLPLLGLNLDWANTRKLWNMLAHLHGNVLNMNNLGKSLELPPRSIKKYLSFLEHAFLIRQLYPFSVNVKKRLVKSPKIYIRDSGMLHHLLNIQNMDELESHPILGHSWEGYVIEQIKGNLDTGTDTFFYRTHEGAEIDLVLVKGGQPSAAIEIKYTSAPKISRGLTAAIRDVGAQRNFIITPNTDEYYIRDNILVCSISTFLKKHLTSI